MDDTNKNETDSVIYQHVKCPVCRCSHCPVQNTQPAIDGVIIRYHKCRDCGNCFKSTETVSV